MNEFLTIKEFADLLRVSTMTVYRAINNGRVNAVRIGGGRKPAIRIPRSEINRIAEVNFRNVIEKIVDEKIKERNNV